MTCMSPPELDEGALLRFLDGRRDGEANQQVARHLQDCAYCRQRARRLARLQRGLTAALYRRDCPTSLELGEYRLRVLPSRRAEAVKRHLAGCPRCSAEVARLDGFLAELAPELQTSATQRIKVWVAELVSAAGDFGRAAGPTLAPGYAGVRGGVPGPLLYRAGDAQIALTVQPDSGKPALVMALGLVTGVEGEGWQARLWHGDQRVAEAPVDELGNFVLAGLPPAVYGLTLAGPEAEIHIPELDLSSR
jgi:anti-sigma factor RsiW